MYVIHIHHIHNISIIELELHAITFTTESFFYNMNNTFIIEREIYAVFY